MVAEGRHWREWVGGSGLHPSPGDRRLAPGGPQGACLRPGQRWPDSSRAGCHLHPAGFLCQPLPVLLPTSRCSSSCGPGLVPHKPTHRRPLPRLHPPTLGELPHCISSPGACTQLVPWQLLTHKMSKTEHVCLRLFPPSGLPPSLPRLGDRHCHPPRLQLPTPLSLPTPHPIRVHPWVRMTAPPNHILNPALCHHLHCQQSRPSTTISPYPPAQPPQLCSTQRPGGLSCGSTMAAVPPPAGTQALTGQLQVWSGETLSSLPGDQHSEAARRSLEAAIPQALIAQGSEGMANWGGGANGDPIPQRGLHAL